MASLVDGTFCLSAKKTLHCGARTGFILIVCIYIYVCLSACLPCIMCRAFASSIERGVSYVTEFHKPSVRSGRAGANAWDFFRRKPSPIGRGRRSAVYWGALLLLCVSKCGGIRSKKKYFTSNAHGLLHVRYYSRRPCLIYLSTSNEIDFSPLAPNLFVAGWVQAFTYLIII